MNRMTLEVAIALEVSQERLPPIEYILCRPPEFAARIKLAVNEHAPRRKPGRASASGYGFSFRVMPARSVLIGRRE